MAAAGNAIFSNLGLLFAIGVAVGLARENHGAAGSLRGRLSRDHQGR
jgi:PTS system N-acetylglucosamine-specific IIC component